MQEEKEIKKLLRENLKLNREIFGMVKGIKNFIIWQKALLALKIILIVTPLILGVIYLPPLFKDLAKKYREMLGFYDNGNVIQNLLRMGGIQIPDSSKEENK